MLGTTPWPRPMQVDLLPPIRFAQMLYSVDGYPTLGPIKSVEYPIFTNPQPVIPPQRPG